MAIQKAMINERNGVETNYHRIAEIQGNYNCGQLTICLESYLSKERRNQEKVQLDEIEMKISRYYELKEKEASESILVEEMLELEATNIQELEARKIEKKEFETKVFTIPFPEELRGEIYKYLVANVPDFKESEMM